MKTSWGLKVGMLCVLSAVGCKKTIYPAYNGLASESGLVQEEIGAPNPNGSVNVRNTNTQRAHTNTRVTMTELGEHRYRLAAPLCTVTVAMEGPDYAHGQVIVQPRQMCEVNIDRHRGPMMVVGNVQVVGQDRTIQFLLTATNNQINPHVEWTLSYNGQSE